MTSDPAHGASELQLCVGGVRRAVASGIIVGAILLSALQVQAATEPEGRIAYVRSRGGSSHIWTMNADGSDKIQLTSGDGYALSPSWAPDNQRIAFVYSQAKDAKHEHIATIDLDDHQVSILTPTQGSYEDPSFSPDGGKVLFTAEDEAGWSLYEIPALGGDPRRIAIEIDEQGPANIGAPCWAPDGTSIAFVGWRDSDHSTDQGDIFLAAASGQRVSRVTGPTGRQWGPAWSPDGLRIALSSYHSPGAPHGIYLVSPDGGPGTHVFQPEGGGASDPSWSPDGEWLALMYNVHGQDIWVMRADGSDLRQLTDGPASHSQPAWSTSGEPVPSTSVHLIGWGEIKGRFADVLKPAQ